jgi:hypothetical protein
MIGAPQGSILPPDRRESPAEAGLFSFWDAARAARFRLDRVGAHETLGKRRIENVMRHVIERIASSMLARGLAPKTGRNVMSFLQAVFGVAFAKRADRHEPVARRRGRGVRRWQSDVRQQRWRLEGL